MFDAKHASRATGAVHVGLDKEHMDLLITPPSWPWVQEQGRTGEAVAGRPGSWDHGACRPVPFESEGSEAGQPDSWAVGACPWALPLGRAERLSP